MKHAKPNETLIISPHCDDSTLSLCGAILNKNLGKNITIYDVFSISNYTINEKGTADWKKTTAIRHQEEINVSKKLGTKLKFIGFKEPLLRQGYKKMDDIFKPNADPAKDKIWDKVYEWGKGACKEKKWTYIFFPLGIGHHIDHKILTLVGIKLQRLYANLPIFFYEDLPYAGGENLDYITKQVKNIDKRLESILIPLNNLKEKIQTLELYASQFDSEDIGWTYKHINRLKGEKIWAYPKNKKLLRTQGEKNEK